MILARRRDFAISEETYLEILEHSHHEASL
jgi:hypothetical protein